MRWRLIAVVMCLLASHSAFADELLVKLKMVQPMLGPKLELTEQQQITITQTTHELMTAMGLPVTGVQLRSAGIVRVILSSQSSPAELQKLAETIAKDARVLSVRPNILLQTQQTWEPNSTRTSDSLWDKQTALQQRNTSDNNSAINLPGAWTVLKNKNAWDASNDTSSGVPGNTGVVVAVIDTGIRYNHPDLNGRILRGYNFISSAAYSLTGSARGADATDVGDGNAYQVNCGGVAKPATPSSWHGTNVAGIIAAIPNNNTGVAGINGDVKILPVRALGLCGGSLSDVIDAMYWSVGAAVTGVPANTNPARIINLSLGSKGACNFSDEIATIKNFNGAMIFTAAGNDAGEVGSPANCPGVVAVAALDRYGLLATYSNSGSQISISAPGGDFSGKLTTTGCKQYDSALILTTGNDGQYAAGNNAYCNFDGTSAAAPMVSGVAALMLSANPWLSGEDLIARMTSTAGSFPVEADAQKYGWSSAALAAGKKLCTQAICGAGMLDASLAVDRATLPALKVNVFDQTPNGGSKTYEIDLHRSHPALNAATNVLEFAWGGSAPSAPSANNCVTNGIAASLSSPFITWGTADKCLVTSKEYSAIDPTTNEAICTETTPCTVYFRVREAGNNNKVFPPYSASAASITFTSTGILRNLSQRYAWEAWDVADERAGGGGSPPGLSPGPLAAVYSTVTRVEPTRYATTSTGTGTTSSSTVLPASGGGGGALDGWALLLMLGASLLLLVGVKNTAQPGKQ